MIRTGVILGLAIILAAGQALGRNNSDEGPLIPVLPGYQEASYEGPDPVSENAEPTPPSPQDQLYVFWLLGQVISYPVDKVEALVTRLMERKQPARNNPPYEFNPFAATARMQVPPAPPVIPIENKAP